MTIAIIAQKSSIEKMFLLYRSNIISLTCEVFDEKLALLV